MKKLYWCNYLIATLSLTTVVSNPTPHAAAQEIPKGQCITNAYGQQLCGYNCVKNQFGDMKCADWPGGVCTVNVYGEITCGPPAPPNWTLGYTSPQRTANPPQITWRIDKHNMSIEECQQRVYQAMQSGSFINIKTEGNSDSAYILEGNINNNTTTIVCQNGTVFIVVAGNNLKTVARLRDSIYQNMGFSVNR
ncbi:hypothetical protein FD723_11170 [Nostoc sp. C052]|uniref:hypothetical protein n=1 Tax=Nostoc sp. C052 TaxID=2576902 RepID=UPI0015C34087|nr:hypothetical protein [Nostoc sp. C052]QLE40959.1 hypothetical protein FD723_11170 [Nostoc sp. C052]